MEDSSIEVLMIDDEQELLDIAKQFLELDRSISVDTTLSATDALKLIERREYDVIVSDYMMPKKDGIQLLKEIRGTGNKIPLIIFTGKGREEVAIEALNAGADYYLQKGGQSASQFAELANMIKQAHARKEGESKLRISEERYRSLFASSVDSVMLTTIDFGSILTANPSACRMFGMAEDEIKKIGIKGLIVDDKAWANVLRRLNQTGIVKGEFTFKRKDGTTFPGETTSGILTGHYGIARISMIVRDVTERELSNKVILENEERYRQLFDNIGIGVAVYEATEDGSDFIFKDFNLGAQNIEGIKKEDLIGRKVTEVFPGVDEMGLLDVFRRVNQTGDPESFPTSLYNDERIMGYRDSYIYRSSSGEVVDVYQDITALKEMEQQIEHLSSFLALSPEPVLEFMIGAGITYANASAHQMLRYVGKTDDVSLLLPKDIEEIIKTLKNSDTTRTVREVEVGGRVFEASILNVPGTDLVRVYETEITKRKYAEETLLESEKKFQSVFDLANDAILLHNLSVEGEPSSFIEANQVASNMLGYSKEELLTMGPLDIVPPEFRPQLVDIIRGAQTKDTFLFETVFQRKDGTTVPVESNVHLVNHEGKRIWISHIRDITERKRVEEALLEVNRKLNLLSSITRHDIMNQLLVLEGNLTMLDKGNFDQYTNDQLKKAEAAAKRISSMVQFTKEYEDVGVKAPIWQNARTLIEKEAKSITLGPIKLVNDVPTNLEVHADPLIIKVFHNLIDNAVRHGGNVTKIHFFVEEHDGSHTIICEDDGAGIPSDLKEKIFTHDSVKGHGFGLFLTREILAITGISIKENGENGEKGKGARFEIIIPKEGSRMGYGE